MTKSRGIYAPKGSAESWLLKQIDCDPDECAIWPFKSKVNGYGSLHADGKKVKAHRFICEKAHGNPPFERADAAHSCGVRACCNPHHLRWATRKENMKDAASHGTIPRGEQRHNAKLKLSDIETIRSATDASASSLSACFRVSKSTIYKIREGRRWPAPNEDRANGL